MATSRTIALPVSVLRKSRTGAARLRAHAVRPVRTVACAVAIGVQIDKPRKRDRCEPMAPVTIRPAQPEDAAAVAAIYNEGIAGRQATFETRPRAPRGDPRLVRARAAVPRGPGWRRRHRGLRARDPVLRPALLRRGRRAHGLRRRRGARPGPRPAPARRARGRVRAPRALQADEPHLHHQCAQPGRAPRGRAFTRSGSSAATGASTASGRTASSSSVSSARRRTARRKGWTLQR